MTDIYYRKTELLEAELGAEIVALDAEFGDLLRLQRGRVDRLAPARATEVDRRNQTRARG